MTESAAQLPAPHVETPSAASVVPERATSVSLNEWSVEVVSGKDKGRRFHTVDGLIRIGTEPTNDLVLSDPTVSRRHLELERTPSGLLLRDLGSKNGTQLDGRRTSRTYVEGGEKFEVGKTKVVLKVETRKTQVPVSEKEELGGLVGRSEPMRILFAAIEARAGDESNVLIEGEAGTGKDLVARTLRTLSSRNGRAQRRVDCTQLNDETTEKELFGGTEDSGTLVLDEVHALPSPLQLKLLRCLESGEYPRAGSTPVAVNVRILSMTQRNLAEEVRAGTFHSELAFRLGEKKLRIPPLRVRKDDLPVLARAALAALRVELELNPQTLGLFENHDWPGNIREFRAVVERGALMQEAAGASWLDFLPSAPTRRPGEEPNSSVAQMAGRMTYEEAKDRVLADFDRLYFAEALKHARFDVQKASELAGVAPQNFYRLLKRTGHPVREGSDS